MDRGVHLRHVYRATGIMIVPCVGAIEINNGWAHVSVETGKEILRLQPKMWSVIP